MSLGSYHTGMVKEKTDHIENRVTDRETLIIPNARQKKDRKSNKSSCCATSGDICTQLYELESTNEGKI